MRAGFILSPGRSGQALGLFLGENGQKKVFDQAPVFTSKSGGKRLKRWLTRCPHSGSLPPFLEMWL